MDPNLLMKSIIGIFVIISFGFPVFLYVKRDVGVKALARACLICSVIPFLYIPFPFSAIPLLLIPLLFIDVSNSVFRDLALSLPLVVHVLAAPTAVIFGITCIIKTLRNRGALSSIKLAFAGTALGILGTVLWWKPILNIVSFLVSPTSGSLDLDGVILGGGHL